jgi:hypothetical protein
MIQKRFYGLSTDVESQISEIIIANLFKMRLDVEKMTTWPAEGATESKTCTAKCCISRKFKSM